MSELNVSETLLDRPAYEGGSWLGVEGERLQTMDSWLAPITIDAVGPVEAGDRVLDIGAGTGTDLASYVIDAGGEFTAVDMNADFLSKRDKGDKIQANAERLPFRDQMFDVTHSRAVTGWVVNKPESIREQLRVSQERAVFCEFDWSTVRGGMAIQQSRALMLQVLATAGFNPEYGKNLLGDVQSSLSSLTERDADISHKTIETSPGDEITQSSFNIVQDAVVSLNGILKQAGMDSVAEMNDIRLEKLRRAVDRGDHFTLPVVHIVTVDFK